MNSRTPCEQETSKWYKEQKPQDMQWVEQSRIKLLIRGQSQQTAQKILDGGEYCSIIPTSPDAAGTERKDLDEDIAA